jgi:hypothetical protein
MAEAVYVVERGRTGDMSCCGTCFFFGGVAGTASSVLVASIKPAEAAWWD